MHFAHLANTLLTGEGSARDITFLLVTLRDIRRFNRFRFYGIATMSLRAHFFDPLCRMPTVQSADELYYMRGRSAGQQRRQHEV